MPAPLRAALIGTGNMARSYVAACAQTPGLDLVAVVGRDPGRSARFASEHGLAQAVTHLERALAEVDLLIDASPSGHHGQHAEAAAAAGRHILVEKPLDISLPAMDRALAATSAAGVVHAVAYQRRHRPLNRLLKTMIDEGRLGRVLAADLRCPAFRGNDYYASASWRGTPELDGGGPFMQQASHDIDLLCWLTGTPRRASALTATLGHPGLQVEDHGAAALELADGGIASVVASTICRPGFPPGMTLVTEAGSMVLANDAIEAWHIDDLPPPEDGRSDHAHNAGTSATVSDTSAHEALLADVVDAIHSGRAPLCDARSTRAATATVLAIYESARTGAAVVVG